MFLVSDLALSVKGIFKSIKHELPERLKSRMFYGFLFKKRESKIELAKIYQKRWFFLISSRPLVFLFLTKLKIE